MSRDIHNRLRGSCLDCGECPSFISISGRVLCDYCGCPPARFTSFIYQPTKNKYREWRYLNFSVPGALWVLWFPNCLVEVMIAWSWSGRQKMGYWSVLVTRVQGLQWFRFSVFRTEIGILLKTVPICTDNWYSGEILTYLDLWILKIGVSVQKLYFFAVFSV